MGLRRIVFLVVLSLLAIAPIYGQSPNATISGLVVDSSGAAIVGAEILIANDATGLQYPGKTNGDGFYLVPNLPPGTYRLQVSKVGFKTLIKPDITLNVQSALAINFSLPLGAISEIVTVAAGAPLLDTTDGTVSTVVDRQFTENLPMNGRSFQSLIELTPGIVLTNTTNTDGGQFSVNGQRAASNSWMVDGVSANIGMSGAAALNQSQGGGLPGLSVLGGTNTLVSVDAMQEFRIQTSTYAPEFGRMPGAQISIVTRAGTNQFHGTAFEYVRNDVFDANDWFADSKGLPKARERINDFGGVIGGPLVHNKTFFFFSYEGQRMRLPQTGITTVPSMAARQSAPAAIQPYLNVFPVPNGAVLGNGQSEYDASFSNQSTLNATAIRFDTLLTKRLTLFARWNDAPSNLVQRGQNGVLALSDLFSAQFRTLTLTLGTTWNPSALLTNDLRVNYSRNRATDSDALDTFGGAAVLPDSALFIPGYSSANALYSFVVNSGKQLRFNVGKLADNLQRQVNIVDGTTLRRGAHSVKFGVDYLRLFPSYGPLNLELLPIFSGVPSIVAGTPSSVSVFSEHGGTFAIEDFGAFAQDTWRIAARLTMTYGLRWELEPSPHATSGPGLLAFTGFSNSSALAIATPGTPLWQTRYGNFAPRLGLAFQISSRKGFESVLRGGVGLFYDLATQQLGDAIAGTSYPFGALTSSSTNLTFPLNPAESQPPTVQLRPPLNRQVAFDPHLRLPYTLEYNLTLEQAFGSTQKLSLSYVGAGGRQLLQQGFLVNPNATFRSVVPVQNGPTSAYNALQLQYQKRFSGGLQALASYTWAHSIDDSSSGSFTASNLFASGLDPRVNRGPSDFDVRNSFAGGLTYDLPRMRGRAVVRTILNGWSIDDLIQARSASPVNVTTSDSFIAGAFASVRPDLVPNESIYLFGSQYPGGKALNPAVFGEPPLDPVTGFPIRQGDLGRNALRGFGALQWDFAFHRQFDIHESWYLQFRAEFFNVLNHPNFGPPDSVLGDPLFGLSTAMLAKSLSQGSGGNGAFNPLYQIGGPRSIQLGLKLQF